METSTCLETDRKKHQISPFTIIDGMTLVHVQPRPRVLKVATAMKTFCELGRSWGIVSMLKSLQKQLQRRRRQQYLKVIRGLFFRTDILSLLVSTGNNARVSFLVHQVLRTSTTVLRYRRVFTHFLSAFECPVIPVV